jgi:hypothetical protein
LVWTVFPYQWRRLAPSGKKREIFQGGFIDMAVTTKEQKGFKVIEKHLRMYRHYKASINNMKREMDYIMPNITASYEVREGSVGVFTFKSDTEDYAIDRLESKRALELHEDIKKYELLVECIDYAVKELDDTEKTFVKCRYFDRLSIEMTAAEMRYSPRTISEIRKQVKDKLVISLRNIMKM